MNRTPTDRIPGLVAVLVATALGALLGACSGSSAGEMLDTARLEEKQSNLPHARQLYREIVERYPGSEQAKEAAARLAALGPGD